MAIYYPNIIQVIDGTQVQTSSNIDVNEFYKSQSGTFYKINAIEITAESNDQVVEPFVFIKKDAEGNEQHYAVPYIIDPYQIQSVKTEKLPDDAILDGNNSSEYHVLPEERLRMRLLVHQVKLKDFLDKSPEEIAAETKTDVDSPNLMNDIDTSNAKEVTKEQIPQTPQTPAPKPIVEQSKKIITETVNHMRTIHPLWFVAGAAMFLILVKQLDKIK